MKFSNLRKQLTRQQMKSITGGFAVCTASCGNSSGSGPSVVFCEGFNCSASDNSGCEADGVYQPCPEAVF